MEFPLLAKTPIWPALSKRGQRIFLPQGIFYWAGRARNESEYNATIGSAKGPENDVSASAGTDFATYYLPKLTEMLPLPPNQIVSYAPIAGVPAFRGQWKRWVLEKCPVDRADLVGLPIVVPAITAGIYFTTLMFLDEGEAIVCPNKRWGNYNNIFEKNLAVRVASFEFFSGDRINVQGLQDACAEVAKTQEKVVVILNFPNNPTGYVPTPDEREAILTAIKHVAITTGKPVVVLLDDAYEGFVYDDARVRNSMFGDLVDFHEAVIPIKLDGLSKEFLAYGTRIGAVTIGLHHAWAPASQLEALHAEWENKYSGLIRASISNSNHAFQEIAANLLANHDAEIKQQRETVRLILARRCKALNERLAAHEGLFHEKGLSVDPNAGGFFLFLNLPENLPAPEVATRLLERFKVGTIPIRIPDLGVNGLRVAYASVPEDDIPHVVDRIVECVQSF